MAVRLCRQLRGDLGHPADRPLRNPPPARYQPEPGAILECISARWLHCRRTLQIGHPRWYRAGRGWQMWQTHSHRHSVQARLLFAIRQAVAAFPVCLVAAMARSGRCLALRPDSGRVLVVWRAVLGLSATAQSRSQNLPAARVLFRRLGAHAASQLARLRGESRQPCRLELYLRGALALATLLLAAYSALVIAAQSGLDSDSVWPCSHNLLSIAAPRSSESPVRQVATVGLCRAITSANGPRLTAAWRPCAGHCARVATARSLAKSRRHRQAWPQCRWRQSRYPWRQMHRSREAAQHRPAAARLMLVAKRLLTLTRAGYPPPPDAGSA